MRIGTVNYATTQGLGYLVKSFHDAGVVTNVAVVRHSTRHTQPWYPGPVYDVFDLQNLRRFCRRMDVMLFFETPFQWELLTYCREQGIPTVLMPMYECMREVLPVKPDYFINPSLLDQQHFPQGKFIPVPVEATWTQRRRARTFVHNAGHGGLKGRNGTKEFLEAIPLVKSDARFIVRAQCELPAITDPRVTVVRGEVAQSELYEEGDVFVFPEQFNGLSLPLQEAFASGMLIMSTARFPMTKWLPLEPLIPVARTAMVNIARPVLASFVDPKALAAHIDAWFDRDISQHSLQGKVWAEQHSWEVLKPYYMEELNASVVHR